MKKIISFILALCLLSGLAGALAVSEGDSRAVIGADLTEEETNEVYGLFGIEKGAVSELSVTNAEERKYLRPD
jgi:uncharacterized protein YpuA (DUF1002 family)